MSMLTKNEYLVNNTDIPGDLNIIKVKNPNTLYQ